MANPTDAKAANAPYWNNDTVTANVRLRRCDADRLLRDRLEHRR
jgi:hypothetical protein